MTKCRDQVSRGLDRTAIRARDSRRQRGGVHVERSRPYRRAQADGPSDAAAADDRGQPRRPPVRSRSSARVSPRKGTADLRHYARQRQLIGCPGRRDTSRSWQRRLVILQRHQDHPAVARQVSDELNLRQPAKSARDLSTKSAETVAPLTARNGSSVPSGGLLIAFARC